MIEHTVKNYTDTLLMALFNEIPEILICTQSAVKLFVVGGFITVPYRFKKRSDIKSVAPDFFNMGNPRNQEKRKKLSLLKRLRMERWKSII